MNPNETFVRASTDFYVISANESNTLNLTMVASFEEFIDANTDLPLVWDTVLDFQLYQDFGQMETFSSSDNLVQITYFVVDYRGQVIFRYFAQKPAKIELSTAGFLLSKGYHIYTPNAGNKTYFFYPTTTDGWSQIVSKYDGSAMENTDVVLTAP